MIEYDTNIWYLGLFGSSTSYTTFPFMSGSAVAHLSQRKNSFKKNVLRWETHSARSWFSLAARPSLFARREVSLCWSCNVTWYHFFLIMNFLFKTDLTHNVHWSVSYGLWHGTNSKTKGRQNSLIGFIPPIERLRTWLQTKADANVEFWIRGFKQNTELTPFLLTQPVSSLSMPSE